MDWLTLALYASIAASLLMSYHTTCVTTAMRERQRLRDARCDAHLGYAMPFVYDVVTLESHAWAVFFRRSRTALYPQPLQDLAREIGIP